MGTVTQRVSPRLAALKAELEAGNTAALDQFWREVEAQGTPLIEPIEGDPEHGLVTFLWRDAGETRNVVIVSTLSTWWWNGCADSRMTRLLASDVWYRTYRVPLDLREMYRLLPNDSLVHLADSPDLAQRMATCRPDPLNPRRFVDPPDENGQASDLVFSVFEMPHAPPQPYATERADVPRGTVHRRQFTSRILDNERAVWVYVPPGVPPDDPCHLLLVYDGWFYQTEIPLPTILDNLLAEGRLPPTIAVLVGNAPGRRLAELIYHPPFFDCVAQEIVPWVREHYPVTHAPVNSMVVGCSAGGAAAAFTGLRHSDLFGAVLCQSGSFWNGPAGSGPYRWNREEDVAYNWLPHQFAIRERLPLRFYLEAGSLEGSKDLESPSLLASNWHMRDVLLAKGYPVHYRQFSGGHRTICWRGTLSDGLLALWGNQEA